MSINGKRTIKNKKYHSSFRNEETMLKIMNDLPGNVLGVSAEGEVTTSDYESVLIPAIEGKLKTNKKIGMIYQLGTGFKGFEIGAMFDDAKIGMKHAAAWDKVAFVSDHPWVNAMKFFGHLMPYEIRIFKNSELQQAREWIVGDNDEHGNWVENALGKINTEFPLSGGETNEDLEQ